MMQTVRQFISAVACAALLSFPAFSPTVRADVSLDSIDLNISSDYWWYMYAFTLEDGAELGEHLEEYGSAEEDVTVDLSEVMFDEWVAVYLYDGEDASEYWLLMVAPDFGD